MIEKASSPTGLALNRPLSQLASPPTPLQEERGVMCFVKLCWLGNLLREEDVKAFKGV